MIDLEPKEVEFLKGVFGSEYAQKRFMEIFEKLISDLKDIENLDRTAKDFNKQIEFRLAVVDKLREVLKMLMIYGGNFDKSNNVPI